MDGFTIGRSDGILKANLTNASTLTNDIQLTIKASDSGNPPLHSFASVRVKISGESSPISSHGRNDYK